MPYCENCGARLEEDSKFCNQCGQRVIVIAETVQPRQEVPQRTSATGEELYLGGFTSGHLHPMGMGADRRIGGCGLYATNRRIIVTRSKKGYLGLVGALGGIVPVLVAQSVTRPSDFSKTISEVEAQKDFEIMKNEISNIELKRPHTLTPGHLHFELNSGEIIKFNITDKKTSQAATDLMQAFCPERLVTME
jgi:hypothetical protein